MEGNPRNQMNELDKANADASYFRETLEKWQDANRDMGERFAKVIAERDALAAALRNTLRHLDCIIDRHDANVSDVDGDEIDAARAALAKLGAEYQPIDANGHPVRS